MTCVKILVTLLLPVSVVANSSHEYEARSLIATRVGEVPNSQVRARRATGKQDQNKERFTDLEKQTIVQKHNELRRKPRAADMLYMTWDNELESIAQEWANKCRFGHNGDRKIPSTEENTGENIFAGTQFYNEEDALTNWYSEVEGYTYSSNTCTATCGHYTQTVWAKTERVGCGIKYCPSLEGVGLTDAYFVVCNYFPAGNNDGIKPYIEGPACSECPTGKENCDNGLCRDGNDGSGGGGNDGSGGGGKVGSDASTPTIQTTTNRGPSVQLSVTVTSVLLAIISIMITLPVLM